MSDYHINIFYSEEDAAYVADIPDLDACSALGQTPEAALTEVEKARQLWLARLAPRVSPSQHRATVRRFIEPGRRRAQE